VAPYPQVFHQNFGINFLHAPCVLPGASISSLTIYFFMTF